MISTKTTAVITAIITTGLGVLMSSPSERVSQDKFQNIAIGLLLLGLEVEGIGEEDELIPVELVQIKFAQAHINTNIVITRILRMEMIVRKERDL